MGSLLVLHASRLFAGGKGEGEKKKRHPNEKGGKEGVRDRLRVFDETVRGRGGKRKGFTEEKKKKKKEGR